MVSGEDLHCDAVKGLLNVRQGSETRQGPLPGLEEILATKIYPTIMKLDR